MEIMGYLAAAFIGISLGLIGGGGSILTVPVLVYLFRVSPIVATSYSLFIVGTTSFAGTFNNYKKGFVDFKTAMLFGIPSVITVFIIRKLVLPKIPATLFSIGSYSVTYSLVVMILFAVLMIAASFSMIGGKQNIRADISPQKNHKLIALGMAIGAITGLLGAGGGFLLIPALIFLVGLRMKVAIGTSLFIIAINSLTGFTGDLGQQTIDWLFLAKITGIATAGIFLGTALSKKIAGDKLKKGFGWFVLVVGVFILIKEVIS